MAETPQPTNPAGLVADPRYRNLLLSLTYFRLGHQPASGEVGLHVENGEGEVWYEPGYLPTLGTIQDGKLIIASQCFPRFAPLTLTITGADLSFHVRQRQVLSFGLVDDGECLMRLLCTSFWNAAITYRLQRQDPLNRVILTRVDQVNERETSLPIHILKGSIVGRPGGGRFFNDGTVIVDRLELRRAEDGELKIQLHGARMEWEFAGGRLTALRVFDGQGPIANLGLLGFTGEGVTANVSFLDTLP